ncbi:MAG: hypothetical protein WBQ73_03635 [Candidatus Babeliales bacterium]
MFPMSLYLRNYLPYVLIFFSYPATITANLQKGTVIVIKIAPFIAEVNKAELISFLAKCVSGVQDSWILSQQLCKHGTDSFICSFFGLLNSISPNQSEHTKILEKNVYENDKPTISGYEIPTILKLYICGECNKDELKKKIDTAFSNYENNSFLRHKNKREREFFERLIDKCFNAMCDPEVMLSFYKPNMAFINYLNKLKKEFSLTFALNPSTFPQQFIDHFLNEYPQIDELFGDKNNIIKAKSLMPERDFFSFIEEKFGYNVYFIDNEERNKEAAWNYQRFTTCLKKDTFHDNIEVIDCLRSHLQDQY